MIAWFPRLAAGRARPASSSLQGLITAAWRLAVEGNAVIEDVESAAARPDYLLPLQVQFLELLLEVDEDLAGTVPVAGMHQLALVLEYGLSEVAHAEGPALAEQVLGPGDDGAAGVQRVLALWAQLTAAFSADLPNPLTPQGQSGLLRALRHWSKLGTATGVDMSFLEPLMKAV